MTFNFQTLHRFDTLALRVAEFSTKINAIAHDLAWQRGHPVQKHELNFLRRQLNKEIDTMFAELEKQCPGDPDEAEAVSYGSGDLGKA